jgi:hypothetical protein
MWWSNPERNLDVEVIWSQMENISLKRRLGSLGPSIAKDNIKITLEQLKLAGRLPAHSPLEITGVYISVRKRYLFPPPLLKMIFFPPLATCRFSTPMVAFLP